MREHWHIWLDHLRDYWHLWVSSLFLQREAYEYQRDRRDSFGHGMAFIALLGIITALFGIGGSGLRYATAPRAEAIKGVVLTHLQAMPFYTQLPPEGERQFISGYNQSWENFGSFFVGYPTRPRDLALLLSTIVTTPLAWMMGWLIYGLLAHRIASRKNANNSLAHGLGTLALATSPQLLKAVEIFPGANVSGLMIAAWVMIANVFALRTAYRLSTPRAIWAALFPLLLLFLILLVLLVMGTLLLGGAPRGGQR